jgi:hypothetical protein
MAEIDPFKIMRNTATLDAYRRYERDARAAGQPWLAIGLALVPVQLALALYGIFHLEHRGLLLPFGLLTLASGLCSIIAALKSCSFRKSHPFVMPETSSAFVGEGKVA